MKKLLAVLFGACLALTAACAYAQPLEDLIVNVVRDDESTEKQTTVKIPNIDKTMGVQGVSQGYVDAYGVLRGEAFLYVFDSESARAQAAWRLDAALTDCGFKPGDFLFEGSTYTAYNAETGSILLMDGVTEKTSLIVLAGVFEQAGGETAQARTTEPEAAAALEKTPELTAVTANAPERQYVCVAEEKDENGVTLIFQAVSPQGDGLDSVRVCFPQAAEAPKDEITLIYNGE